MSLETVTYAVPTSAGPFFCEGVQVGRFAVRKPMPYEKHRCILNGEVAYAAQFIVDHIPTGACVQDFETFADALSCADDLSRFSREDPKGKSMDDALRQMGPEVMAWVNTALGPSRGFIGFREWQLERARRAAEAAAFESRPEASAE